MKVKIEWQEPIQLTRHKTIIVEEKTLLGMVEKWPGIYFFSRKRGDVYKPFYVAETTSVKGRLKVHWHTPNIQFVLRGIGDGLLKEIKGGERYFHCGYLIGNTTKPKKYLDIGQKYLIRQAIAAECTLINKNLTKISMDTLEFRGSVSGRAIYPKRGEIEA
jgi:hypothetical protein